MDEKIRIHIHFNGCGYYWCTEKGVQISKSYKAKWALEKYGKLRFDEKIGHFYY